MNTPRQDAEAYVVELKKVLSAPFGTNSTDQELDDKIAARWEYVVSNSSVGGAPSFNYPKRSGYWAEVVVSREPNQNFTEAIDAAIAATKVREPILNEAVELERWRITQQYIAAADTKGHGLGDVLKRTLEEQVDEVVSVYGLKTRPGVEGVFNRAMLPAASQRVVKV